MGKTLEELGFKEEVLPVVPPEEVPAEFSAAPLPPYPGVYWFKLPTDLSTVFDKFEVSVNEHGILDREGAHKSERLAAIFDGSNALEIIHAEKTNEAHMGGLYNGRVNTAERNRARKGHPPVHVSDMTYLLQALGDPDPNPGSNKAFGQALVKYAGREFKANLEWTTSCNTERQVYYEQEDEVGTVTLQPGFADEGGTTPQNGCGNRYYMNDWPKDESGRYRERRTCSCGASLRPFGQLRNFGPSE